MARKVTRVRVPPPKRVLYVRFVAFLLAMFATPFAFMGSTLAGLACLAMLSMLGAATFVSGHAIVGDGGVQWRWLFLRSYVPFSNVEHVVLRTVTQRVKSGETYTSGHRIEMDTLEGRDVHIDVGGNVRELFDVVEDPTAKEESRAAAAVVLASARDESVGDRLRIARDASASPSLQKAIDAALEGQDDAIARALDDVRSAVKSARGEAPRGPRPPRQSLSISPAS